MSTQDVTGADLFAPLRGSGNPGKEPSVECNERRGLVGVGGVLFDHKSLRFNESDVSMTPPDVARRVVNHFKPQGRLLDPCRGDGAFWNAMPGADWCEIREGRDFMEWKTPVDWIVTNPPFSTFMGFIAHAFDVAENVVFVIPAAKVWGSMPYHEMIEAYGGIREIVILGRGRAIGLPLGFAVGAFHFKRGYKGETRILHSLGGGGAEHGDENGAKHSRAGSQNDTSAATAGVAKNSNEGTEYANND